MLFRDLLSICHETDSALYLAGGEVGGEGNGAPLAREEIEVVVGEVVGVVTIEEEIDAVGIIVG